MLTAERQSQRNCEISIYKSMSASAQYCDHHHYFLLTSLFLFACWANWGFVSYCVCFVIKAILYLFYKQSHNSIAIQPERTCLVCCRFYVLAKWLTSIERDATRGATVVITLYREYAGENDNNIVKTLRNAQNILKQQLPFWSI